MLSLENYKNIESLTIQRQFSENLSDDIVFQGLLLEHMR